MAIIEVIRATPDQEPILANLLELYIHDFSEIHEVELSADGRFGYKNLPLYWRHPNRHPFLVRVDGKLAGFVFVKQGSAVSCNENTWDMAEFFVLRSYRKRGIGTETAHQIWRRFPRQWEIRVMESNQSSYQFWQRAIAAFLGQATSSVRLEKNQNVWHLFTFKS